jgi:hypothetical protein
MYHVDRRFALVENTMGGVPSPAAAAVAGLQGMQLSYDETFFRGLPL